MNTTTTTSLDFAVVVCKSGLKITAVGEDEDLLTFEETKALNPKALKVLNFHTWDGVQAFCEEFWESRGMEKYNAPMPMI